MLELKAKPVVEAIHHSLTQKSAQFHKLKKRAPKLVVVLVGEDPASVIYTTKKHETAIKLGFLSETIRFDAQTPPATVKSKIDELNHDPFVDGILIQRPLPKSYHEEDVVYWVHPSKDVDAFHPENVGKLSLGLRCLKACTPYGVIKLLEHYKIDLSGRVACVVGRSSIVGKPMAQLLLQKDATLLQAHSKTPRLETITSQADVLVVAAGKQAFITEKHIKPGATVVDVGMHRLSDGRLCGDCDFSSVSKVAGALTPVPGGIGPMTIAMLMQNTLEAALMHEGVSL